MSGMTIGEDDEEPRTWSRGPFLQFVYLAATVNFARGATAASAQGMQGLRERSWSLNAAPNQFTKQ